MLARSDDPFALHCIRRSVTDGIIVRKTDEMVNSDDIIHLRHALHTGNPPIIVMQAKISPAIKRIAPKLAFFREVVRRNTCNPLRNSVPVQLENLRMGPGVSGILCHIDRHIAEDSDIPCVAVFLQRKPLTPEKILAEDMKLDFILQHFRIFRYSRWGAAYDFRIRPG